MSDETDRSEDEWLRRVAAGDSGDALVALYRTYSPRIHRLGLRTLRDAGHAEELVQETFVRLWQSAHRFDPARGSARAFTFTIAQRAAIDILRRASVRPKDAPKAPNHISAGTWHPDKRGITDVRFLIAADPEKLPRIEVTREPPDGDPRPSGRVVLAST